MNAAFVLAIATLGLASASLAAGGPCDDKLILMKGEKKDLPKVTLAAWKALDQEARFEALSNAKYGTQSKHFSDLHVLRIDSPDKLYARDKKDPIRVYYEKVRESFLKGVDAEELDQTPYGHVDTREFSDLLIYLTPEGKILGSSLYGKVYGYFRDGETDERTGEELENSYSNWREAKAAGVEKDDSYSWSATAYFDEKGNYLDTDDGAGFTWSGA